MRRGARSIRRACTASSAASNGRCSLVTLGIYYLLPFIRWDRGPNAPHQAVLIDFPSRRFYFFFIEIWPQEIYYLTGLLILAAIDAVPDERGRRPHLVRLSLPADGVDRPVLRHRALRRRRPPRAHAARRPQVDAETWARKGAKHFVWLMVAWWTGGAWVLYFADAPTLVHDLATGQAPFIAYALIGILTFTTYTLAGHMREQVCLYMCPWPRIQAALTDEYALNVTYRYDRGEPRCSVKKAEQLRAHGEPAGDCVDCLQCVHVCPTGVDIRGGADLGCIQCGLCIDACDTVMAKLGRADRAHRLRHRPQHQAPHAKASRPVFKLVRWRTLLYAAIIAIAGGIMIFTLATRDSEGISVIHDRNPMFVRLSDGALAQRLHHPHRQQAAQVARLHRRRRRRCRPRWSISSAWPPRADGRQLVVGRPRPDPRSARDGDRLQRDAAGAVDLGRCSS